MPFCTECGSELPPGAKFCEECGAPVDTGPVAPAAAPPVVAEETRQPLVRPLPPQKPFPVLPFAAAIIVLVIIGAAAVFFGLPYLGGNPGDTPPAPVSPTVTPVAVAEVTLPSATLPPPTATPTVPVRKLEGRYEEYYDEIYALEEDFLFGESREFTHNLAVPPLYIKYNLTPKLLTRKKVINIGLSTEQTINITNPSPNAWFEVQVLDAGSGGVVKKTGYGKDYPDATKSEFMVRAPGNYRVVFSGHDVFAEISVLQGKS